MKILNTNKRSYYSEGGREVTITAVLVAGDIDDYAVYVGCGSDNFVARTGHKISFKEAICHFPIGLVEEKYRED